MDWDQRTFGRWLRTSRVTKLPTLSQEELAARVGVTQAKISRWEQERPNTTPPDLEQCVALAELFDEDPLEVARMCRRWNDEIERRVLASVNKHMGGYLDSLERAVA